MIKGGTRPTRVDHRDYDFKKTFGRVDAVVQFLPEYNTDAGLTMPDQNAENDQFTPVVPPLERGCTDYGTSEVSTDLDGVLKNPMRLEEVTKANALGGYDVRDSLLAGKSVYGYTGIFNIRAIGQDMFDAVRDAMVSGASEKRSVSVGSKWFSNTFESVDATGILGMPNFSDSNYTWHNWKICGWKTINDQVYLVGKSWQGKNYGDKGLVYFSRPLFNQLMAVRGSVAFTATKGVLPPIETISTTWLEWLISNAHNLLGY